MKDPLRRGWHCVFDPSTGIKKYRVQSVCDRAYKAQQEAAELGIGPPVVRRLDKRSYVTEVAEPLKTNYDVQKNIEVYNDLFIQIQKLFRKHGIRHKHCDFRTDNLGIWNGKEVMLDFS